MNVNPGPGTSNAFEVPKGSSYPIAGYRDILIDTSVVFNLSHFGCLEGGMSIATDSFFDSSSSFLIGQYELYARP